MWHQWFNLNVMKLWEYLLKTKITTLFNNFFSSLSVFDAFSREYHNAYVWCCQRRRWRFDAEPKRYSYCITLHLNHWCHMDYFNSVPFWSLNVSVVLLSMQCQKSLGFHQKYLNLCSEDERRSYGFGTTWGWVINDRIFIFG